MWFVEAGLLINNTATSCVKSLVEREILMYLLMAHFALLQSRIDAGNSAVGRVSSATEGSVSVSFDNGSTALSAAWYQQTPYGAKYWAMTAKYRSFLYVVTNFPMRVKR
ncbi:DUF4054 domain-containing protein [Oligella sp. MSHR50489EDL]|uniref:DUF4054 domain-containing protein n=1 Tax=Oligella sp. MSHR50489EDL TaxID=3139409 RepID=UPI003D81B0DC